jgi:hypothetical protein
MPFKSQAQRAYLYANHPDIAKEFEAETPPGVALPGHARKAKTRAVSKATHRTRGAIQKARIR